MKKKGKSERTLRPNPWMSLDQAKYCPRTSQQGHMPKDDARLLMPAGPTATDSFSHTRQSSPSNMIKTSPRFMDRFQLKWRDSPQQAAQPSDQARSSGALCSLGTERICRQDDTYPHMLCDHISTFSSILGIRQPTAVVLPLQLSHG